MHDDLIFIPPAKRHFDPWAYVFVAPAVVLLAVFLFLPALWTVLTSVVSETAGEGASIGFSAYIHQTRSALFWRAVVNTIYFGGMYVPGAVIIGYLLAWLMHRNIKSRRYWVILFAVPALLPSVTSGTIWRWLYDPETGLVGRLPALAGRSGIDWLGEPKLALPSIAVMCIWQSAGLVAAIFLAAMLTVPKEYEDIARLDGARGWRRLFFVSLPSVQSALRVSLLLLLINAHRVFGPILVMTRDGGPANWSTNLPFLVYREAMKKFEFNAASALTTMLCFTIAIMVVLLRRFPVAGRVCE